MELTARVLNDVRDDKVTRLPNGVFMVAGNTQIADHEQADYIATLRRLMDASWVMESRSVYPYDGDGIGVRLRLTTIGEVRRDELMTGVPV